ncbi:MAG: MurT ligase domain-containing protein [Lachnospirales bacterium]
MKNIYNLVVVYFIKIIIFLMSDILKRGSSFPGLVAKKLSKNLLTFVSNKYKVVFVTGTNGKTTTTSLIVSVIRENGLSCITNESGANMYNGILTTFVKNYSINKKSDYAIIEIDEANLKLVTPFITPYAVVITNIFRDQLDRYGEVYNTLQLILKGIDNEETILILNGDEPLLNSIDLKNKKVFFGFDALVKKEVDTNTEGCFCIKCNNQYSYNSVTYNHLGDYFCEKCGFSRPSLTYKVEEILEQDLTYSIVKIDGITSKLNVGGLYNIYNVLCAYAVTAELGFEKEKVFKTLENQKSAFGRQEIINVKDKKLVMLLVKNPVGFNEALNSVSLNNNNGTFAFLLNDNYADGRDVSWIWDVNFENIDFNKYKSIYFSGTRRYDMAIRIQVAGANVDNTKIYDEFSSLYDNIVNDENEMIFLFTTYTAMLDFRKFLVTKGHLDKIF